MRLTLFVFLFLFSCAFNKVSAQKEDMSYLITPELQEQLALKVNNILDFVDNEDYTSLGLMTVYRGEDTTRNWKSILNPWHSTDYAIIKEVVKDLKKMLSKCPDPVFEKIMIESESEGIWYVYVCNCSNGRFAMFAFLRIDDEFVLGDVDMTM